MEAQKPTYDDLAPGGDDGLWLWRGKPPNPTQLPTPTGSRKLQRSFLSVAALLVLGSSVAHRPVKFGRRFWAKAHTASWWSLVRFECVSELRLRSIIEWASCRSGMLMACLVQRMDLTAPPASRRASP